MTQVTGTHNNTQNALNAIEATTSITNKNIKDIIYGYSSVVAKVLQISDDHKSSPEHEKFINTMGSLKKLRPDTLQQGKEEIGKIQQKLSGRKCLTSSERRDRQTELDNLMDTWDKKIMIASSQELVTLFVNLQKKIDGLPEVIDWSTVKTTAITPVKEGETPMIEIDSPVDGIELQFGQGRSIVLKKGSKSYPVPHIQTLKKAKTQAVETVTLCDPNEPNNTAFREERTVIWDIEPNKLKIEEPDVSYPKKIKVGEKIKFTLNNPVPGAKIVGTELSTGATQRFDASQTRTFELDSLDTSTPTAPHTKRTVNLNMLDENFLLSPSTTKTIEIEIEAKEMDFHSLNVDPDLEIKEGEVPTIPLMRGVKEAKVDVTFGTTSIIDSGSQKLSGGDQGLNLDPKKVGPGGSVINTDNVNKKAPYLVVVVTDPHYPTNQVRKRVKLDVKPSKLEIEKPVLSEKTFTHGESAAKMTVDNTTPGTSLKIMNGTAIIGQRKASASGNSTEITLDPSFTKTPQKTDLEVIAVDDTDNSNNETSDKVSVLVKMDLDKLTVPKTDIEVKIGIKKPTLQINGGTKDATLASNGADLGKITNNGNQPLILDLETNKTATDPEYNPDKPDTYKCNLIITDPNDDKNTKTITVNFIIKPREVLSNTASPNVDPTNHDIELNKADALIYTVKNAEPGEEIVVKGPNGFEHVEKVPGATIADLPITLTGLDTSSVGSKGLTFTRRDPNNHDKVSAAKTVTYEVKEKDTDKLKIKEAANKPKVGKVEVEHNAIEVIATLENPIPGSKVTITGGGITKTVIVPHNHPEVTPVTIPPTYESLKIKLDGFPTKEADKVTNMTVMVSDPSDENIKNTSAFDVEVGHDHLHENHNYRLDEQSLRDAKSGSTYTIYEDGSPKTYKVSSSKRWLGMGWKAEVPVLKGEKPKYITARTKTNLIEAVRAHCKDLENRAHAKSHGDHENHAHPTETPHATPSDAPAAAHTTPPEAHAEHAAPASKGFFKTIGSGIAAPFKWSWKQVKKIPIVPRITAGAGLLASAIYAGSAPSIGLFSSAAGYAAAGFISPLALLTGIGLAGYQIGKWTGWIKGKEAASHGDDHGGEHVAHTHAPAGAKH